MINFKPSVMITGSVSLLGKYLVETLSKNNLPLILTSHNLPIPYKLHHNSLISKLDISNKIQVSKIINKYKPQIIIHLAALSNIDYCEKYQKPAYQINVNGTRNISEAAYKTNVKVIFISSNAIFDGFNPPYQETDHSHPLNYYGYTKELAEKIILANKNNCVIRLTTMFGWPPNGSRNNDITYFLQQLKTVNKIYLVNDRFFNPVSAQSVSENILKLININFSGIIHLAGKNKISRFTFVKKIKSIFLSTSKVELIPVSSDYFPNLAKRPVNACLSIYKAKQLINFDPPNLTDELIKMSTNFTAISHLI